MLLRRGTAGIAPLVVLVACALMAGGGNGGTVRAARPEVVNLRELPDFYGDPPAFRCDPYLRAAATVQQLGQDEAVKELSKLASQGGGEKVIVLCRMLFTRKEGGPFRRPLIGGAGFLGGTDYATWPLEPIEIVDGVPFLVVQGYSLGGRPELASKYLDYCVANCAWNEYRFVSRSAAEKQAALARLLGSAKWKRPLEERERRFLADQIGPPQRSGR